LLHGLRGGFGGFSSGGGGDFVKSVVGQLGDKAGDFLKKYLLDPSIGKVNMAGLGTAAAALKMLTGGNESTVIKD
jgi:hypothetical protein